MKLPVWLALLLVAVAGLRSDHEAMMRLNGTARRTWRKESGRRGGGAMQRLAESFEVVRIGIGDNDAECRLLPCVQMFADADCNPTRQF